MKMNKTIKLFTVSWRDILISLLILGITFAFCFLLKMLDGNDVSIPIICILAIFLISRFTDGYLCGTVSSIISVLGINYVFTYPYFAFNFTLSGYPVAIVSMLVVSIITSALTTQIKQQEKTKYETEIEKNRSNLLCSVSHDLRTPLTSILGASSAIMENDDILSQAERLKLIGGIKEDAQWLMQMVENLLSITRINGNRQARIIKKPESIEEVVADSLQKFKKRFPDFKIEVSVPDELLMVPMDVILIEQVLINLLENAAVHASSATQVCLTVYAQGENVIFEVRDNGKGIPKEVLPHIFEGCYHQKSETADAKKNMGIGLSVCYTIIKVHGGTMTAYNSKTGGAVFRFSLPKEEQ